MAGLFSGAGGVLFVRPGLRLWSLTRGSVKYSRGDTGHGGGLGWTASSCELLHLQAVLLCTIITTGRDDHARSCHFFPPPSEKSRVSAESERMMEHDGRDTVSEITTVSQSVLVKLHYHPLRFCAAAAAAIHLPLR